MRITFLSRAARSAASLTLTPATPDSIALERLQDEQGARMQLHNLLNSFDDKMAAYAAKPDDAPHYDKATDAPGIKLAMDTIHMTAHLGSNLSAFERKHVVAALTRNEAQWKIFGGDVTAQDFRQRIQYQGQLILQDSLARLSNGQPLDQRHVNAAEIYIANRRLIALRRRPQSHAYRMWPTENLVADAPKPTLTSVPAVKPLTL